MVKIGFIYPGYENLGIEYLSANLKKNGFETKLFLDPILFMESGFINNKALAEVFSFRKYLLQEILTYRPDLICFSVITDNYLWACNWAQEISQHINAPIVFGGIHPTSVPERVIEESFVDYICIGEGDIALIELAEAIRDKKPTTHILNVWSKVNGSVIKNKIRPLISNLDTLPFPDKDIYYQTYPVFRDGYLASTSRGCPFECSYCCNNVYHSLYKDSGKVIRRRSIDNVIEELELVKNKYKPAFIHFVDDVFNFDTDWLSAFLTKYEKKVRLPFSCYVYPDLIDDAVAKRLKETGCFKIQMGLQVIDDNKRKIVLKRSSKQDNIAKAIDSFKKAKIYVTCDNIFGFPDETEEECLSLCYFYNEHTPDHCENFWLRYYPKTEITEWAISRNYIDAEKKEEIERGKFSFGLFRRPEHLKEKPYTRRFIFFLTLYPFLHKSLRSLVLKNKLYRFFPPTSSIFLYILARLFNHPKYDFNTLRTIRRYFYLCAKKCKMAWQ